MCMLCGDTFEQGKKEALLLADDLERLAAHQRNLAYGRTKPHGEDAAKGALLAKSIVRTLVAEYI